MSFEPSVSLVIVSRKRRDALLRMLKSLRFQSYQNFEVIVVSDALDASLLNEVPHHQNILHISFEEPNISAARNLGIGAARGDVVAFCDDDAIPDPMWLERLIAPFEQVNVASSGGFVRGRNGIEYQWRALLCDEKGDDFPFEVSGDRYSVVPFDGQKFAKLQGTNCAFRRKQLISIDGFRFFLDETDVCLRLAKQGHDSAFVPNAQVHHGFEASDQRSAARVPHTLYDIGASKRRFLQKHARPDALEPAFNALKDSQKSRLIRLMIDGRIEPRDVSVLLNSLEVGFRSEVKISKPAAIGGQNRMFRRFGHSRPDRTIVLAGSSLSNRKLINRASELNNNGAMVLVMVFSITSLFHRRWFDERGFWVQRGGLFGRSKRTDPLNRFQTLTTRIRREFERVRGVFPAEELHSIKMFRNFVLEKTESDGTL